MQPRDTVIPPAEPAVDNQPNNEQPPPWMIHHQFQQPWTNQRLEQWMDQQQPHLYQLFQYPQQVPPQAPAPQPQDPAPQPQAPAPQPQALAPQPTNNDEARCLWIGELQPWMNERFLFQHFGSTEEVVSTKVIRNRETGVSEGYGFIECVSHAAAERILESYHGSMVPHTGLYFKLNWAHFGFYGKPFDGTPDFTVYVGNLSSDVTNDVLLEKFRAHHYTSIKHAWVVMDQCTRVSKGYGFVSFADETEKLRAMREMNGQLCSTREMRVAEAFYKNEGVDPNQKTQEAQNEGDSTNSNIFVGGLAESVSEDQLWCLFRPYGEINHVIILAGKGCGYVKFAERHCAEVAMEMLNGTELGGHSIRLSRGCNRIIQPQADPNQWTWGHYYGYAPIYENYGYIPQYDPNHYGGGAYWGYGNFQPPNQQQQHQGNFQPPHQQQQHQGNFPHQQQQHQGNFQPPHQQQQHQGNFQPPHQQRHQQ